MGKRTSSSNPPPGAGDSASPVAATAGVSRAAASGQRAARPHGTRTVENLHHFQCGACRKWWSIGDAPERNRWFCPWCGRENRFV